VTRVAIVGGGIAGLAAALRVVERAPDARLTLLEAGTRLGGTISTVHTQGFTIEDGPDSFITDKPWALALCERLGLAGDLVGTRDGDRRTHVARGDRLYPLPEGFLLLAPTSLGPLARSSLFSLPGKLRMALDLILPRGDHAETKASPTSSAAGSAAKRSSASRTRSSRASIRAIPSGSRSPPRCRASASSRRRTGASSWGSGARRRRGAWRARATGSSSRIATA
jgi:phytoene dehydrogenase-like protein